MLQTLLQSLPLEKVFWTLMALEIVGFGVLCVLARRGPRSPEGPVGGWLVLVPPVIWIALGAAFLLTKSPSTRASLTFILSIPLLAAMFGPLLDKLRRAKWERGRRGADYFLWPAQRRLAGAIYDHDVELVKQLIPGAGDLNKRHSKDETLFTFAVRNADTSDASVRVVEAMLAAGANPNVPPGEPLKSAILTSPKLTKTILERDADPNALGDDGMRPVWWQILANSNDDGIATLRLLLDHGANPKARDSNSGPVAWAAQYTNWRALAMLVERGADWRDEAYFGTPVSGIVASRVSELERRNEPVPPELREAAARYESVAASS